MLLYQKLLAFLYAPYMVVKAAHSFFVQVSDIRPVAIRTGKNVAHSFLVRATNLFVALRIFKK